MHYLVTCMVAQLNFQGELASWPLFAYDYLTLLLGRAAFWGCPMLRPSSGIGSMHISD